MSTVVDSLVVTLGLDDTNFSRGLNEATSALTGFATRIAGVLGIAIGLEEVIGYFKDLHHELSELGFYALNLGIAGTELARFGEVAEHMGGQASDAISSVQGLQSAIFALQYRGEMSDSLAMLQRFGIAYLDAAGHARKFVDIARDAAREEDRQKELGVDQGQRLQLALSFGFTGGIAAAIAQGTKGFEQAYKEAATDQKSLTESAIDSQTKLSQEMTRVRYTLMSNVAPILQRLTPAIEDLTSKIQHLISTELPKITHAIDEVETFFKNPPPWVQFIKTDFGKLQKAIGPTGADIAAFAAITAALGAGGVIARLLGAIVTGVALLPLRIGAATAVGAVSKVAPLAGIALKWGGVLGAGLGLGKLIDMIPTGGGKDINDRIQDWVSSLLDSLEKNAAPGSHLPGMYPTSPAAQTPAPLTPAPPTPAPPTPSVERPAAATEASAGVPTASNLVGGGTSVQVDSMTIVTQAKDAYTMASDVSDAFRRKFLVSNSDVGYS